MRLLLLLSFCFIQVLSYGQKVELSLFIIPTASYRVLIDNSDLYNHNKIYVTPGEHNVKVWAPHYEIFDTTINFAVGEDVFLVKELMIDDAYTDFLKKDEFYETKLKLMKGPGIFLSTVSLTYSIISFTKYRQTALEIEELKNDYPTANTPDQVRAIKENISKKKVDFNNYRKQFNSSLIITGSVCAISAFLFYKANKLLRPSYQDRFKLQFNSYLNNQTGSINGKNQVINSIGLSYAF